MNLSEMKEIAGKRTKGEWFATIDEFHVSHEEKKELETEYVWTVGPNSDQENWRNDSNCGGYGILKTDAEFIACMANNIDQILDRIEKLEKVAEWAKKARSTSEPVLTNYVGIDLALKALEE